MKTEKIQFVGGFHGKGAACRAKILANGNYFLSDAQLASANRAACGMRDCKCGGTERCQAVDSKGNSLSWISENVIQSKENSEKELQNFLAGEQRQAKEYLKRQAEKGDEYAIAILRS